MSEVVRARASTKPGRRGGSGTGSVSALAPPRCCSGAGFVSEPAGGFWKAPAQRELGRWRRRLAHARTSASASEGWTWNAAGSRRSSLQFSFGPPRGRSLNGKSGRRRTRPAPLQATGLSRRVPGTEPLGAGRWKRRLGRSASGLRRRRLLWRCPAERGLCARVSQLSPPGAESHPV